MNEIVGFLMEHGTVVVFTAVLAEQIGLPVPAVPFLIAAGALAAAGHLDLAVAAAAAIVASLVGDQVWFELGRRRGRHVLGWLCRIAIEPASCIRRTEDFFSRHGVRSLVVAKFVPGLSTVAPPLAGIVGLRLAQFLLFNGAGTVLWVGTGLGAGYLFADQLERALAVSASLGSTVGLLAAGGIAGYVVLRVLGRYRDQDPIPVITAQRVREKLRRGEQPLIVDLRPAGARRDKAGISDALPLSADELVARHRDLPRDQDVILYCDCPADAGSIAIARILRKKGLTKVWPLAGGVEAWRAMELEEHERESSPNGHPVAA
jgi:membrane protein DedA with SNARE-associated domain/rhodanese-related sulfurtransferase